MSYDFRDIQEFSPELQGEIESIIGKAFLIGCSAGAESSYDLVFNYGYRKCLKDYELEEFEKAERQEDEIDEE